MLSPEHQEAIANARRAAHVSGKPYPLGIRGLLGKMALQSAGAQMAIYRAEVVLATNASHPSRNTDDFSEYLPIYGIKRWRDAVVGPRPFVRPSHCVFIPWDGTEAQLEEICAEVLEIKGKLE